MKKIVESVFEIRANVPQCTSKQFSLNTELSRHIGRKALLLHQLTRHPAVKGVLWPSTTNETEHLQAEPKKVSGTQLAEYYTVYI